MESPHPTEFAVGIEYYASESPGTGGRLRDRPSDFRVREIERIDPEPLSADPSVFTHLLIRVTLTNWDTNAFARELSNRLGISRERITWAGTKDKRAVTTQLFTLANVSEENLPELSDVEMEVVGRLGRALRFGDLAGNEFEIVVRDPDAPGHADAITTDLNDFGAGRVRVPNYFGQQRFGSRRPVTHEVGLAILQRDWESAVMRYIGNPHPGEPAETRTARAYVDDTRDWQGALDRFPGYLDYERAILHRLADSTSDSFQDALDALPSNLQRLFVHAVQSYLFNRILSARIDRDLPVCRAVEGDIMCFGEEIQGLVVPVTDRTQAVTADRISTVNRHIARDRAFVTAPLIGTNTDVGDAEPAQIVRTVLSDLEIERSDFDLPGVYASTGSRRALALPLDPRIDQDPLCFSFRLPKGAYATGVMREYLKTPPAALT